MHFSHARGWWAGISLLVIVVMLAGCAGSGKFRKDYGKPVTVTAAEENLRDAPSGSKVGEVVRGKVLTQQVRRGNWVQVTGAEAGQAWIWAPSLGYDLVNPADIRTWLGPAGGPVSIDAITDLYGPQTTVQTLSGSAVEYTWNNYAPENGTLFGTDNVREVRVSVDRASKLVFASAIVLPPFQGKTKDALTHVGLSEAKSTTINGDRARYDGKFPGAERVELEFYKGDFLKIGEVRAWRYDPDLWHDRINVSEQKAVQDGSSLNWSMTLTNLDNNHTFAAPVAEVELVYHGRSLGTWTLDASNVRVPPGQVVLASFPIPIDISDKNVKEIAGRAELLEMTVLPGI
jgi:hypothetical protein